MVTLKLSPKNKAVIEIARGRGFKDGQELRRAVEEDGVFFLTMTEARAVDLMANDNATFQLWSPESVHACCYGLRGREFKTFYSVNKAGAEEEKRDERMNSPFADPDEWPIKRLREHAESLEIEVVRNWQRDRIIQEIMKFQPTE